MTRHLLFLDLKFFKWKVKLQNENDWMHFIRICFYRPEWNYCAPLQRDAQEWQCSAWAIVIIRRDLIHRGLLGISQTLKLPQVEENARKIRKKYRKQYIILLLLCLVQCSHEASLQAGTGVSAHFASEWRKGWNVWCIRQWGNLPPVTTTDHSTPKWIWQTSFCLCSDI